MNYFINLSASLSLAGESAQQNNQLNLASIVPSGTLQYGPKFAASVEPSGNLTIVASHCIPLDLPRRSTITLPPVYEWPSIQL